jgi:hypothetical protein
MGGFRISTGAKTRTIGGRRVRHTRDALSPEQEKAPPFKLRKMGHPAGVWRREYPRRKDGAWGTQFGPGRQGALSYTLHKASGSVPAMPGREPELQKAKKNPEARGE